MPSKLGKDDEDDDDLSWPVYRRLILDGIYRLEKGLESHSALVRRQIETVVKDVEDLKRQVAIQQVKIALAGLVGSVVISLVVTFLFNLFTKK